MYELYVSFIGLFRPELDRSAERIYSHHLMGFVHQATHSSNAQYDDEDIVNRLTVQLLKVFICGRMYFSWQYRIYWLPQQFLVFCTSVFDNLQIVHFNPWRVTEGEAQYGMGCIFVGLSSGAAIINSFSFWRHVTWVL